jgi:hypothetical protein
MLSTVNPVNSRWPFAFVEGLAVVCFCGQYGWMVTFGHNLQIKLRDELP